MDVSNLARVFGPTLVGHAVPNPDPMSILQDTKRQPKVGMVLQISVTLFTCTANCSVVAQDYISQNSWATQSFSVHRSTTNMQVIMWKPFIQIKELV